MEQINADVLLMIGRVEGKVDSLISLASAQSQRIDALEARQSSAEVDIATLKTSRSQNNNILSHTISALSVIVAGVAAYFSYKA